MHYKVAKEIAVDMEYEVGKYYDIVCMKERNQYSSIEEFIYTPIIDSYHKDPQFGADFFHYHVDGRFATKKIQGIYNMKGGRTNCIVGHPDFHIWQPVEKVIKRMKCKRLDTGLKTEVLQKTGRGHQYWHWYATMIGKSCKGKRCPHLGTMMIKKDGKLICPLHSLVGCPKKEIIIPT